MMTPEHYFFLTVLAATVVKLLNPPVESWREAVSTMLSAFLCAYVLTDPIVSMLGPVAVSHPEAATLSVGALLALTGIKVVQTVIRLSNEASATATLSRTLDLLIMIRTGGLPPSRQLPPPSPEEVRKGGDDNVQS